MWENVGNLINLKWNFVNSINFGFSNEEIIKKLIFLAQIGKKFHSIYQKRTSEKQLTRKIPNSIKILWNSLSSRVKHENHRNLKKNSIKNRFKDD